jgi:hypothetical protein
MFLQNKKMASACHFLATACHDTTQYFLKFETDVAEPLSNLIKINRFFSGANQPGERHDQFLPAATMILNTTNDYQDYHTTKGRVAALENEGRESKRICVGTYGRRPAHFGCLRKIQPE